MLIKSYKKSIYSIIKQFFFNTTNETQKIKNIKFNFIIDINYLSYAKKFNQKK
jgi:hypothetical protein